MEIVEPTMQLRITDDDFDPNATAALSALGKGSAILGPADARQIIFNSLPKIIARRLQQITPPEFQIAEITMTVNLKGAVCGVGIEGDVTVKFAPPR